MIANPIYYGPDEQHWLSSQAHLDMSPRPACSVFLEAGIEKHVETGELDNLNIYANNADMLGMRCIPTTMADFLKERFSALSKVRALLVGESNDIYHVWILLDEWTQEQRLAVYAVQRDILQKVKGFDFDFYVLDIPSGSEPCEMVSGIPVVFQRN